jgi:hypothetical protein
MNYKGKALLSSICLLLFLNPGCGLRTKKPVVQENRVLYSSDNFQRDMILQKEGCGNLISGGNSLLVDSRESTEEWNEGFRISSGLLEDSGRYRIRLDYKVLERNSEDDYFYFLFVSAGNPKPWKEPDNNCTWRGYTVFRGKPGEQSSIQQKVILPGECKDYELLFGVRGRGAIQINALEIQKLTPWPREKLIDRARTVKSRQPYEPYGICFQGGMLWVYKSEEEVRRGVRLLADTGVQWIRIGVSWTFLEWNQGEINKKLLRYTDATLEECEKAGITPYIQLLGIPKWASRQPEHERYWACAPNDLEYWREHVRFVVKRYGNRVDYWEVWNEWDWTFWEGSIEEFVPLLRITYEELKAADPGCQVILGGLASDGVHAWDIKADVNALQRFYDAGGGQYYDIFSMHPYAGNLETGVYESIDKINTACEILNRNGDGDKPVWLTELGASTWNWLSLEDQAAYVRQVYDIILLHPAVDKVFWYNFRCIGEDPKEDQHNFGLVNYNFTPRPAYKSYQAMPKRENRLVYYPFSPSGAGCD